MLAIDIDRLRLQELSGARLSLKVGAGEAVALVDDDQHRVTPIIRRCGGLDPIDEGRVQIGTVDVGRADRHTLQRMRQDVGYVSIGGGLFANTTLAANVALPLRYRGMAEAEADARARELLAEAGLQQHADLRAATIASELQKLAAYVRALALQPGVLLVEDAAAHLHPHGRRVVQQLLTTLRARGATVLLADDDRELARHLTDRVVELSSVLEAA